MITSTVLHRFQPSAISEIFARVQQMRADGHALLDFSIGEPDFDTPEHIRLAGKAAIDRNETRYTPVDGSIALREAARAKFAAENGLQFKLPQIVAGMGAKPLLAAAVQAVLSPGDEAILSTPCWTSHLGMVELAGGTPVLVPTCVENGFKLSPEQLAQSINSHTRLVILCSPSNPTGAVYSPGELGLLARVLRAHPDVAIISDDLYEHILFDDLVFATIAQVEPALAERVLTVNGLSKSYSMTGWRVGYAGGPAWWSDAIRKLYSHTSGGLCSISAAAGVAALTGPQDFLKERALRFQQRRDLALAALAAVPGLRTARPGGAFYLMPDCSGLFGASRPGGGVIASSRDFASYLLEDWQIVVIPGEAFASAAHFRIATAVDDDTLRQGMDRIQAACMALT